MSKRDASYRTNAPDQEKNDRVPSGKCSSAAVILARTLVMGWVANIHDPIVPIIQDEFS